jgi:cyclophilin family peptidyl-prolyl cis-trans isomerase
MHAGTLYDKAVLKVVVDGYTAPVSAGNFVDLVQRGLYKGMAIQRSDGFVIQTVLSFSFFFNFFAPRGIDDDEAGARCRQREKKRVTKKEPSRRRFWS